ncbi:MAG: glycoside hydrolase family 71/99-like protein [Aureliella sp.]
MNLKSSLGCCFLLVISCGHLLCDEPPTSRERETESQTQAASVSIVDRSNLTGKVMVGYQGWFNCQGDGADLGWTHWARNRHKPFAPGNVTVDLWPDVTELDSDERYATGFTHQEGSAAEVFSSGNRKTVLRHFQWMHDYGIDGAFLQRFANGLRREDSKLHKDRVLAHVRDGANLTGRSYAVMYDLSGLPKGGTDIVRRDWTVLADQQKITQDPAYQRHNGKPVVAIWGIGFNDRNKPREYTLAECIELVTSLKRKGCAIMLGVPTGWRTLDRDAIDDPRLHELLSQADVISPWTVGRYRDLAGVRRHARERMKPDIQWCEHRNIDYMPVAFPGFSWHNMKGEKLDSIPRLKGEFLSSQITAAHESGCQMLYVAMFDEVDEGTAIFKCTNDPPTANGGTFLTYEGLPTDHYLKLVGRAGKLLRGE